MTTRVGFSTPKSFNPVSWLVRQFTKSQCSHAWFLYTDKDFDMEMVMEAHELGFRLVPFEHFIKKNRVVAVFTPQHSIDEGLKHVATRYLGTMYDYTGLIGMVVVKVGQWLKKKWKNPFRGANNVFCSEAVVISMRWSEGYAQWDQDPDSEDPQALMDYFVEVEQRVNEVQALGLDSP